MSKHKKIKSKKKNYNFHNFELAFCGYSGSGKTTLIEKIVDKLSKSYKLGFVKHDAHSFEMDKKGKDTFRIQNSGAKHVFIHNKDKWAGLGTGEINLFDVKNSFLDLDFILIEGHKFLDTPKLVILGEQNSNKDSDKDIYEDYKAGKLTNVLGFVGVEQQPNFTTDLPYFQRDNIQQIANFIIEFFEAQIKKAPIYGLVLSGGKSSRMGQDKGAIDYHGISQTKYLADELNKVCEKTFISCREEQSDEAHLNNYPQIKDSFLNLGPMGGILSAFAEHPNAVWMVVACDLPFVNKDMFAELIENRNIFKTATCFINPDMGWAEPLCTIYEPKARNRLFQFLGAGYSCPRKMLLNSQIHTIKSKNIKGLENANTPEDYKQFKKYLEKENR